MHSTSPDGPPELLEWSLVTARGPDAESFLQGQLSQDLRRVDEGPTWTAVLAPDGVVIAAGLLRRVDDGLGIVVVREVAEVILARLRRFLLRSRCSLDVEGPVSGPFRTRDDQIDAYWPGPSEFERGLTPHSFGARFVASTVSFDKGCFTGQELVARLDVRAARVPWRLVRARGYAVEDLDAVLRGVGPATVSGVTSWGVRRDDAGRLQALGVVHRSFETTEGRAQVGDVTVEEIA